MGNQRILKMCNYLRNNVCHIYSLFVPSDNIRKVNRFTMKVKIGTIRKTIIYRTSTIVERKSAAPL